MNRRQLLTLVAGVAVTTVATLGLAHGHGHESHSHHHNDGGDHEHHDGDDHQHDDLGQPSHYHHDHDDYGNHYHNCRHVSDDASSQQYRDGCVNHDNSWEDPN
jgi:hypothetical protein